MPDVDIKMTHGTKTVDEITLKLNGCSVPKLKEKITIDHVFYTVRSVIYTTAIDQTSGNYYISRIQLTVDDEQSDPK